VALALRSLVVVVVIGTASLKDWQTKNPAFSFHTVS
jgi:hypothetical protein